MMDDDTALSFSRDPPLMGGGGRGGGGEGRERRGREREEGEGRERRGRGERGEGTVMSAPQVIINPDLLTASKGSLHL